MTNGKEFALVLRRFCEDRHLTSQELSLHIGRPYSTIRRWMSGKAPRESVVRDVCVKIGVDSEAVLGKRSAEPMAEFDQTLRFFHARYRHWIKTDPMKAHEILGLAGVVAYHQTLRLGLRANFTISTSHVIISPVDTISRPMWALGVLGNDERVNIEFMSLDKERQTRLPLGSLNDASLQNVVEKIHSDQPPPILD